MTFEFVPEAMEFTILHFFSLFLTNESKPSLNPRRDTELVIS